ncbi:MAG TPA: glycoside hydrolase family 2 TIM barrel-domain containing protein [Candidatus Hydrogenedentes bacterium]|nr:glycoside hydrolase family 2 TIM barrel-domain containing protein [Candidatus Hydrogenedentota bacterium]HQM49113.1 glycoside hydrolase family 2 TIM barrel-domain containing protein [Candidatus Hydrogenedentota bacterium]
MRLRLCVALALLLAVPIAFAQAVPASAADEKNLEPSERFLPDVFSHRISYRREVDLNGVWEFKRDPGNIGESQGWHEGKGAFEACMTVPGAPQAQGHGEPHQYQRTMFMEPFWIRRSFSVPPLAYGERLWLRIGGILPAARIYVNGREAGYTKSSRTPQRVDITDFVRANAENAIAIKVCELPEVRMDGMLEWNEGTQLWSGPYRPIYCEIAGKCSVIDAYVRTRLSDGVVEVDVDLSHAPEVPTDLELAVKDGEKRLGRALGRMPERQTHARSSVKLRTFEAWSPEHPKLYTLEISLKERGASIESDKVGMRFGMREFKTEGTKFYLNGAPLYVRCFGEHLYYPDTLCPPSDVNWYAPRLRLARQYGMNAVKGCVEAVPPEFLEACDEAGILVIQEMPFGLSTLRANRYTIDERFRRYYSGELDGLVRISRNHASVMAYSMSSEMSFDSQTQESFDYFSGAGGLPGQTRRLAPHALVIDCTGYVNTMETKKGARDTDFYASIHPLWLKDVFEELDMESDGRAPMVLHEYNWWSSYPDVSLRDKYADSQLKPFWLDRLEETARAQGQAELIPLYHKNSTWLQTLSRKDGIEYARRGKLIEGYILWLLIDYGHWTEGLLDDFWSPKNITPEEFLKSNGDTVIVLAQDGNRCLPMGAKTDIPLGISHYGESSLDGSVLKWKTTGPWGAVEGEIPVDTLPQGAFTCAGSAQFEPPAAKRAYKLGLEAALYHKNRLINTNNWSFWAFPDVEEPLRSAALPENAGKLFDTGLFLRTYAQKLAPIPASARVVIADTADEALANYLEGGGRCLLFTHGSELENMKMYYENISFYPLFRTIPWNAGDSGNSGTLISPHPAMEAFPHEGMCDLPFINMLKGNLPMEFSPLRGYGVTPIIRGIDHYYTHRNNAHLLEFKVGDGRVLACTLGVLQCLRPHTAGQTSYDKPEALCPNETVEARYLLKCFWDYMNGSRFSPAATVPREEFVRLFRQRAAAP